LSARARPWTIVAMRFRFVAAALAATLAAALAPTAAAAKAERSAAHPIERVWPTAVRFLRVDERLTIVDKDADAGYVVFELGDGERTYRGALELVATTDDGQKVVRLILTIDGRPEYTEAGMLDRLVLKIRSELGDTAPAPPPDNEPKPRPRPRPKA
jgi:hypothetical protein